ncbi:PEGA domain-containing protein [Methanocalculus taiwanensis]|uniref:PEGA domain-containing protein n=1 Tax=Methanocalculus taiwanensis TaxID=106207 RepID=A0ABD4TGZ7_9EURY|nr:PEGA domain-containing protein [Methanocalculus taiwanensis]MCQ1537776.1 PEGA domain-containing protein [Methanocalculus taiwanensis]
MNKIIYLLLGLALLALPASAAVSFSTPSPVDLTLGDPITLTGTAEHTTVIYLFMTGPGLNPTGVSLNDRQALAETGNMVKAYVTPAGSWEYTWYTQGISGKSGLSAGTYTLYASDTPQHAGALKKCTGCAYDTITVLLSLPVVQSTPSTKMGDIDIRATSGLTILLDGVPMGATPSVLRGVSTGIRVIELKSGSYYSWSERVAVSEGATVIINANPRALPKTGSVSVTSSPSGYPIIINGANTGTSTPGTITGLTTGLQIVELRAPGYNNWKRSVTVYPGKTEMLVADLVSPGAPATTGATPLPPPTGSLRVISSPAGANVNVGDQFYGITPVTIPDLATGPHQVTISLAGYSPWSGMVSIASGETLDLSPTLSPLPQPTPAPFPLPALCGALFIIFIGMRRR